MSFSLEQSYRHCARVSRRAASNFYWSFWLVPRAMRRAMFALYAFSRHTDDLGDSDLPAERRADALQRWRESFQRALAGHCDDPILPAVADSLRRYTIPARYLHDVIDGVEMDLIPQRYETFEDLQEYCRRVATAVGLACLHVWGCDPAGVREQASACGLAFQLTNILRDVKEDLRRDRVYVPLEDFRRFGYSPEELAAGIRDVRFANLMRFEIERAQRFYEQALPLSEALHGHGRYIFRMMLATYWELLREIRRRNGDVFTRRVRLSPMQKLASAASALLGSLRIQRRRSESRFIDSTSPQRLISGIARSP